MLLSLAVVLSTGGPGGAQANEGTTIWYLAAVACLGSSSSYSNTSLAVVACRGSSSSNNTGPAAMACRGNSSNSSNGLTAVVSLISINVAPILFLSPGRRDSSNRCSNHHGKPLRSELAGSTTAGATPYTSRRTHLPRQAHRCVRCTAVAVAVNMGTSPNTVLHRVGLGNCGACGQYGHMWRNCALSSRQPHLNVFTSFGECYVTNAHGADTIVIPQQQQANAVDLGG